MRSTQNRRWLDPLEVNALLKAYDIPTAPVILATTPEEAAEAAGPILAEGGTVAVKVLSPDIVHKSDIGGVQLDLTTEEAVRKAAAEIFERAARLKPQAHVTGVTVQPMVRRAKARELIAGLADDPTFGPVVVFGRGGTAVEVINDKALALPPLDLKLADDLIARTRVSRRLKAYRDVPAADERAIALTLVKLAQLAADLPEIRELDINPLLADRDRRHRGRCPRGGRAARRRKGSGHPRFAVRPYPKEWERHIKLRDGKTAFVRPVRPEDEEKFQRFFEKITPEDLRLRFFAPVRDFSHAFLARLTQLDYARAIAFVAFDEESGEMMGAVRLHADANHETGEYGILLRSDLKGLGLGWELMRLMIEWAKVEGLARDRRAGAAREHHHARHVPQPRLLDQDRSGRSGIAPRDPADRRRSRSRESSRSRRETKTARLRGGPLHASQRCEISIVVARRARRYASGHRARRRPARRG